jgi:hypothetical protein
VKLQKIEQVSDEFWWEVARKCKYATFYHTPILREFANCVFSGRYRNESFGAILPSGTRIVFPLYSQDRRGPLRKLESSLFGCYGGFIADGPVSPPEAAWLYAQICKWPTYSFYFLENPYAPPLPDETRSGLKLIVQDTVHFLKIDADFDTIFSQFSRTLRNAYRGGLRQGVKIRLAISIDDYHDYYHNYRDAVARWGEDDGYDWHLFAQLYQLSRIYPDNIKLWLMMVEEQIVGGRIVFYWGEQASGWNGTAHRDYLNHHVMPVADTEILRDAIERGFRYFDFNTSDMREGVIAYKQRFGSVAVPVNAWIYEQPAITMARAAYRRLQGRFTSNSDMLERQIG